MTQLLQNAVYGTVLILAVAALRGALKDRLLPEARLALWAVCLFRLFTPTAPASALSLWGLFRQGVREIPAPAPAAGPNTGGIVPVVPGGAAAAPAAPAEAGVSWSALLAAVWIAVAAILAARYVLAYARTRRAVGRAIPLGREDARYAALPRCARLREGPLDGAPLTFGVVRPTVVLTPGLDGAELACVLAHEGVHARRRDNLWHYAAAAALTVFWWDPAVWLMARLMRRDVELSCDRATVRRLGEDRRAEYANALVTLSTQAEGGAFCHGFGPKRTEERIIAVMKYRKTTVIGIALTLALVLAVTVGFASNPGAGIPDEESTTSSAPAPFVWGCGFNSEDELIQFSISLDWLAKSLAEHVANGSMSSEDFGYYMDKAKAASQDGVTLKWTFAEGSGLFADWGSPPGGSMSHDYYLDGNGNKVYVDPATLISRYVFPPDDTDETASDAASGDLDGIYLHCIREDCPVQPAMHYHEGDKVVYVFVFDTDDQVETHICFQEDCPFQPSLHIHEADGRVTCLYNEPDVDADDQDERHLCYRDDCPLQPSVHIHETDGNVTYVSNDLPLYVDAGPADAAEDGGAPAACPSEAVNRNVGHHSDSHHASEDSHH